MFKDIGPFELILILAILLLIFGAGRLAGVGRAMGESVREFRKGMKEGGESQQTNPQNSETGTKSQH